MDRNAAQALADRLMADHDIAHQGWTLEFNPRLRSVAGRCDDHRKVIELRPGFVEDNDEDQVRDTILHEIAHALSPDDHGHGRRWRHIATTVGAVPSMSGLEHEPVDTTAVEEWADRIRPLLARTVDTMMDVGRELIAAKAALPYGNWMPLLHRLQISRDVAERFMRIARSENLKRAPAHTLPPAPTILDELAKLPADMFDRAVTFGTITPAMSRDHARRLVAAAEAVTEAEAEDTTPTTEPDQPTTTTESDPAPLHFLMSAVAQARRAIRNIDPADYNTDQKMRLAKALQKLADHATTAVIAIHDAIDAAIQADEENPQ